MILSALALTLALNASAAVPAPKAEECRPQTVAKKTKLTFPDGKTITVDVVDTPATRETGLMCRRKLGKDYGMLFAFPAELGLNFWMKKTLVSVAVAGGRGEYVLELPAGAAAKRGLKPGDQLAFDVEIPKL
ncbi:MAG: DUF192 domain-containing protein [Elusimicrobia bacterium]|nr:DUF192 domain-containing protein [Elusimicrobiota bacterium]